METPSHDAARAFRLDVEDALAARGWTPVERIIGRRVNVFWEHPDVKGTMGLAAAVHAQLRREKTL